MIQKSEIVTKFTNKGLENTQFQNGECMVFFVMSEDNYLSY